MIKYKIFRWIRKNFNWKRCLYCGSKDMYNIKREIWECKKCGHGYTKRVLRSV